MAEPREPPIYRPFALLAFGSAILLGAPLGQWMLAWLYLGARGVPREWMLLHASAQIFGFFGVLIVGIAQHVLPRFAGRAVRRTRLASWLLVLLLTATVLRVIAAAAAVPGAAIAGALLQALAFAAFGIWVWRMLDAAPLRPLRLWLARATAWLAGACALEAALRTRALALSLPGPDPAVMPIVYAMALFGGVLGWVLGVLLRAGPMFIRDWTVPSSLRRTAPWSLGAAVVAVGVAAVSPPAAAAPLARLADVLALGTVTAFVAAAGAFRRAGRALPMLSRGGVETRIFRLAGAAALAAMLLSIAGLALAWRGSPDRLVADAVRHLLTVGVLTSVVVAMSFRLLVVLGGRALRWPRLREVAFWALVASISLRSLEVLAGFGWQAVATLVALSGLLAWVAMACVAVDLPGIRADGVPR
jgi:uncharacterized protein involved in response to NO